MGKDQRCIPEEEPSEISRTHPSTGASKGNEQVKMYFACLVAGRKSSCLPDTLFVQHVRGGSMWEGGKADFIEESAEVNSR